MFQRRPAAERGRTQLDWLESYHSFSFGDYRHPDHHRFRALRVINEDVVAPGTGFGLHPHRDMEIITVVLSGSLAHRDSLGTGSVIRPGEVQRMTAGRGIFHSEQNPSTAEPVHLLQIWIQPDQPGLEPSYDQRRFELPAAGQLVRLVSPDGAQGSLTMHQQATLFRGRLAAGQRLTHRLLPGRHAWVQVISGDLTAGGQRLAAGDGLAVSDEPALELAAAPTPAGHTADFLLFDLG